jgi:hypothetical protein
MRLSFLIKGVDIRDEAVRIHLRKVEKTMKRKLDIDQFDEEALLLSDCDEAILMVTVDGVPVYSYESLLGIFQGQGMTEDEAIEWIDYNVLGLAGNGKFHVAKQTLWEE